MASSVHLSQSDGPRRSILDLAPLELVCMNALWSLGEGTVRDVQQCLVPSRPRAYTTIMTIMDRLARKGIVTRSKVGRAYLYRPNLSAEQARTHAVEQVVEGFFGGSREELAAHVAGASEVGSPARLRPRLVERAPVPSRKISKQAKPPAEPEGEPPVIVRPKRLDESLL